MKLRFRLPAVGLAASLLLTTAAQALNPSQALTLLNWYYLDPLPDQVFEQTDMNGIIQALGDPYTEYFTAEEYAAFHASLSDSELVGAGVSIQLADDGLLVTRVIPGSAAEAGGLLAGDVITAIDGQSCMKISLEQASALLGGEVGTSFQLTYLRDGQAHTVTLTRCAFVVPTAYTELWEDHIGYVACDAFGPETAGHVQEGLETYGSQADHWIMDLRNNGGGEVTAALNTISYFAGPNDQLVYMRASDGSINAQGSQSAQITDEPLIVLTNFYSASASELFASAIRDTGSGLLVGARTYGKGVAQILLDSTLFPAFFSEGDALKMTAYRFFGPAGTSNDTIGVMPHLLLNPSLADEAAVLLSSPEPQGDTSGTARIDLNGAWYIDLEQACSTSYQAAFTALLEALPDGVLLRTGTGDGWEATTAADLAKLAAAALDNELFAQICSSPTVTATVSGQQRTYKNNNKLLSAYPGCIGVKTGFTDEAGRCLVSAARQDGVTLVAVTLHDPNDWADHTQLLNEGFSQVEPVQLTTAGENVTLNVTGGQAAAVSAVPGEELWRGITPQQLSQVEQRVYADPFLYAPVAVGEEVGRVEYYLNGRKLAETSLLAAEGTQRAQVTEQPDQPQSWWEKFLSWLGLG